MASKPLLADLYFNCEDVLLVVLLQLPPVVEKLVLPRRCLLFLVPIVQPSGFLIINFYAVFFAVAKFMDFFTA